jgi:hypothetical protein
VIVPPSGIVIARCEGGTCPDKKQRDSLALLIVALLSADVSSLQQKNERFLLLGHLTDRRSGKS